MRRQFPSLEYRKKDAMSNMTQVAVLDDWQGVARGAADWAPLQRRAEVVFFSDAFADQDDAAANLADFDIVLSMRERTPLPGSLINRLPKLRMLGITGRATCRWTRRPVPLGGFRCPTLKAVSMPTLRPRNWRWGC
jgi:hypothetical protein